MSEADHWQAILERLAEPWPAKVIDQRRVKGKRGRSTTYPIGRSASGLALSVPIGA